MFKTLFNVLLFSCLIFFCTNPAMSETKQKSKAVVNNPEFDFKEVKQGETVEHTFKIQNQGDLPIKILNVRPG